MTRNQTIVAQLRARLERIHGPEERITHCQAAGRIAASKGTTRVHILPGRPRARAAPTSPKRPRGPRLYDLVVEAVTREMTRSDVYALLPGRNTLSIKNELLAAVRAGDLRRLRYGVYAPASAGIDRKETDATCEAR
jgi:hypothetical protein